jgi:O-antigen/teichoic acid export membrane protein
MIIIATYLFKLQRYVGMITITGIISVLSLRKGLKGFTKKLFNLKFNGDHLKIMWKLAQFALLANLVGTLLSTLDIYYINYLVEDKNEIGYYMFALTIVSVYQLIPISIQQVSFPFFSNKAEKFSVWYDSYKKYNGLAHLIIILLCISGVIIIPPFIRFAFSGKYNPSIVYFQFLSLAWMFTTMNMMKGTALMGYGKFNLNFKASLLSLIISFPVMYFLINRYGLAGAVSAKIITGIIIYLSSYLVFTSFLKNTTR